MKEEVKGKERANRREGEERKCVEARAGKLV